MKFGTSFLTLYSLTFLLFLSCLVMKHLIIRTIQALCIIQPSRAFYVPRKYSQSRLCSHGTDNCSNEAASDDSNRRSFLMGTTVQILASFGIQVDTATARGLARFPCKELKSFRGRECVVNESSIFNKQRSGFI